MNFVNITPEWQAADGPYLRALFEMTKAQGQSYTAWIQKKKELLQQYKPKTMVDFACLMSF